MAPTMFTEPEPNERRERNDRRHVRTGTDLYARIEEKLRQIEADRRHNPRRKAEDNSSADQLRADASVR